MGACLSSSVDSSDTWAFVISNRGELRHYPVPIFVSEVLHSEKQSTSFFLCNSDSLYCDKQIPALDSEDELDAGQIYFILPKTMLGRRLTAPDMAALAVKASVALDSHSSSNSEPNSNKKMKKNKAQISPLVLMEASQINVVVEVEEYDQNNNVEEIHKQQQRRQRGNLRVSRSGSIRKSTTPRYSSSKKSRLRPLRSFTLGLSTIYENEGCSDDRSLAN